MTPEPITINDATTRTGKEGDIMAMSEVGPGKVDEATRDGGSASCRSCGGKA